MKMVAKGHIHHTTNWPQGVSHICCYSKRNEVQKKKKKQEKKPDSTPYAGYYVLHEV